MNGRKRSWPVFEPKSDEVTGGWRKLHNESSITCTFCQVIMNNSRRMRWAGHVAHMGDFGGEARRKEATRRI
jgi:hypothetical protein